MRPSALAVAATLAAASLPPAAAQQVTVIASNPQGSVYYTACVAIAKVMDEKLGMQVRVQPMGGSTTYIPLLDRGEIEFALTNVDDTAAAFAGRGIFRRANRNLRAMAVMFPLMVGFLVPDDSPIRTIADLKGKQIPGGYQAQVIGRALNAALLAAGGLREQDVRQVPTPTQFTGIELLGDGKVDAAVLSLGAAQVQRVHAELAARGGLRYLDVGNSAQVAAAMRAVMPARPFLVEPAPARVGVKKPMWLLAFDVVLTTNAKTGDETAYRLVRLLHESKAALLATAPALANFSPERMTGEFDVPWHPGAIRFYREIGQWPPKD